MLAVKYQVITVRNKQNKVHLSSDLSTTKCKVFRFKRKVAFVVDNRQLARGSYVFLSLLDGVTLLPSKSTQSRDFKFIKISKMFEKSFV